jgi:predicted aspartyl protease
MSLPEKMRFKMRVDTNNQWFITLWVMKNDRLIPTEFKVDTGCNAVVLSHDTIKSLGYSTNNTALSKLPSVSAAVATGDKHQFKRLGNISLFRDASQAIRICDVEAVCHPTKETNDLLGTEALRRFSGVTFTLTGDRRLELVR